MKTSNIDSVQSLSKYIDQLIYKFFAIAKEAKWTSGYHCPNEVSLVFSEAAIHIAESRPSEFILINCSLGAYGNKIANQIASECNFINNKRFFEENNFQKEVEKLENRKPNYAYWLGVIDAMLGSFKIALDYLACSEGAIN